MTKISKIFLAGSDRADAIGASIVTAPDGSKFVRAIYSAGAEPDEIPIHDGDMVPDSIRGCLVELVRDFDNPDAAKIVRVYDAERATWPSVVIGARSNLPSKYVWQKTDAPGVWFSPDLASGSDSLAMMPPPVPPDEK